MKVNNKTTTMMSLSKSYLGFVLIENKIHPPEVYLGHVKHLKWIFNPRPATFTAQKMKFSIKDFFSKYEELLKKSIMENSFFVQCLLKENSIIGVLL